MVVQANKPIRLWGKSKPLSQVTASFMGQSTSVLSAENGKWSLLLPAVEEYVQTGQLLTLKSGNQRVVLNNILVGEVWFCAGQSNMEWPVSKTNSGKSKLAFSSDDKLLRLFNRIGKARGSGGQYNSENFAALVPENFSDGRWVVSSPTTAASFSAVGYYFASKLRKQLDCPIGVINVSVGGTPIESWIASDQLLKHASLKDMLKGNWLENPALDHWCQKRAKENLRRGLAGEFDMPGDQYGPNHSFKPGFMYSASVSPFQPMTIRGVLWYQGESNADNPKRISQYQAIFPLMVKYWRQSFENPEMPWVFVQLPAMDRPHWPLFREQQRKSLKHIPNVGMAITLDLGDKNDVHPRRKKPVGERLAAWALNNVYGKNNVPSGPLYNRVTAINRDSIVISFDHVGAGLKTVDGLAPIHFEIAATDKRYHKATAIILNKDKIKLRSPHVPEPVYVRYAWSPFPEPKVNLVNSANLPASPFTTE